MKKLRLAVEELRIDTFETVGWSARHGGTVLGQSVVETVAMANRTQAATCPASCAASCNTCDYNTCNHFEGCSFECVPTLPMQATCRDSCRVCQVTDTTDTVTIGVK